MEDKKKTRIKKPTIEKVMADMKDFDYELQMYCYHKLNGRDEEAQGYLDAYFEQQDLIKEELKPVEDNLDKTFAN